MIKGRPCKVINIAVSKTGKHFTATDIFTGRKLEDMVPGSHGTTVPIVTKSDWEITDIDDDGRVTLMDEGGNERTDISLPGHPYSLGGEIRDAWAEGENIISVSLQKAVGEEQIISYKNEDTLSVNYPF